MRNKVTNQPRVELDTVVVCNKDIISDAEKSCPTGEDPLAPKNECACLSACNVWCQGAYNIIGAFVAFVSSAATIIGLVLAFLPSSKGVGKNYLCFVYLTASEKIRVFAETV